MELNLEEIVKATCGKILLKNGEIILNEVCTDTRKIKKGNVFIALKGENFNGNEYAKIAIEKGASIIIVDEINFKLEDINENVAIILVEDGKKALGNLAKFYRNKLGIKVVGVTGSTGKTSTKDLVAAFLSGKYNVFKTEGNFNNDIGLPIMILKLNSSYDVAVLELGMNNFGEIDNLANICRPDIAVVTNVGVAHIEYLKSRENILKEKMSIANYMNENNVIIINCENDMLRGIKNYDKCTLQRSGYDESYDIYAKNIKLNNETTVFEVFNKNNQSYKITLNMVGEHNVLNALLGIGVCINFGMSFEEIEKGLNNFKSTSMRLEFIKKDKFTIINDSYNANPDSMKAALNVLNNYEGKRKIAVLGCMGELGEYAKKAHEDIGKYAKERADLLLTVGKYNECYKKGFGKLALNFENKQELIKYLENNIKSDDVILVKASRSEQFEMIIEKLK